MLRFLVAVLVLTLIGHVNSKIPDSLGVLYAKPGNQTEWIHHYCIFYNPLFHGLPPTFSESTNYSLVDFSSNFGCDDGVYNTSKQPVRNRVVAVARGNCTFSEKAYLAQDYGAAGILIVDKSLIIPGASNSTDLNRINITVAAITWESFNEIQAMGSRVDVQMFSPDISHDFEPSIIFTFLIAIFCVAVGGYWSGVVKHAKHKKSVKKHPRQTSVQRKMESESSSEEEDEDETVDISLPAIIVAFVLVCGFLIALWYFYDYLVYVVIVLFCFAGASGLYSCVLPIWNRIIPWKARIPPNRVPCFKSQPEIKSLFLILLCCAVAVFWGVERNSSYAWILQDILGLAFCINMLKTIHIPSLMICFILLSLLFVYDIFFVFITPLLTKNGSSIMVDVATGGPSHSGEMLPMVFKVPKLTRSPLNVCALSDSLLGFGDVIVPGLLISYNYAFDLKVRSSRVYYIVTCIGYGVGLIFTYVALNLTQKGQPALLYLVPCTLIPTILIGLKRGELKKLWRGDKQKCPKKDDDAQPTQTTPPVADPNSVHIEVSSTSSSESEQKTLLNR